VRRVFLLLVMVAALAALMPALARGDFKLPGGGVYCSLNRGVPEVLTCWRAKTGLTLAMSARGPAAFNTLRSNRNTFEDFAPPLRIGRTWSFRSLFTCKMASDGLTCKNRSKHGWFMGRTAKYRLF
jgi:hypothetical protein